MQPVQRKYLKFGVFLICLIITNVSSLPYLVDDTDDLVYSPDPDCTKYWQYINGTEYQHNCPAGLHFNPNLNVCDDPDRAGCNIAIITTTTDAVTSTATDAETSTDGNGTSTSTDVATSTDGTSTITDAATSTDGTSTSTDAATLTDGTLTITDAATSTDGTTTTSDATTTTEAVTIIKETTTKTKAPKTAAPTNATTSGDLICYTPECINAAYHILYSIDETVDPCDDFYKFSCGNYLKYAIAIDQMSPQKAMNDRKNDAIKQIVIEKLESEDNLTKSLRQQRKYYRTCMNTTAIEEDHDKTFLAVLKEITGGWPLSHDYSEDLHWHEIMIKTREKGLIFNYFLNVNITDESKKSSVYLNVTPPPVKNFDEHLWKEENIQKIIKITDYWENITFGDTTNLKKTIEFANNLKEIVVRADKTPERETTISALKYLSSFKIDWLQFLKNITNVQNLKEDDIIFSSARYYLEDLYHLINKTPTKFWLNYILLFLISKNNMFLSKNIENIHKQILCPSTIYSSRRDFCFASSIEMFKGVAEAEYIRREITDDKRKHIREMMENIKTEFDEALKTNLWMDETTKEIAIKLLKNVTVLIGWTDNIFNETEYEKMSVFDKLNLDSDNIVKIHQELFKYFFDSRFNKIKKDLPTSFERYCNKYMVQLNAFYIYYFHFVLLCAPYLHLPIYGQNRPEYMNYGTLGNIIGHELTHALSTQKRREAWNQKTQAYFKNKSECINNEYNSYTIKLNEELSNATTTFNENLGDFTAHSLAYQAYQKWVEHHGTEKRLPGVKYSPNQLFWIMSGTYRCLEPQLKKSEPLHGQGVHAVSSFRVIGPLRNSPYFGKDFGCPEGSRMNPKEKCRLFV